MPRHVPCPFSAHNANNANNAINAHNAINAINANNAINAINAINANNALALRINGLLDAWIDGSGPSSRRASSG
jgi:hypothetical protein